MFQVNLAAMCLEASAMVFSTGKSFHPAVARGTWKGRIITFRRIR